MGNFSDQERVLKVMFEKQNPHTIRNSRMFGDINKNLFFDPNKHCFQTNFTVLQIYNFLVNLLGPFAMSSFNGTVSYHETHMLFKITQA